MGHVKMAKKFSNVLNMDNCDISVDFFFQNCKVAIDIRFF